MLFAFQQLGSGILITTKSYLVRTVILGIFFFLLIPVGKLVLIKLVPGAQGVGLLGLRASRGRLRGSHVVKG